MEWKATLFLVRLGSHSTLLCKSPTQFITLKPTAQTNHPPFLGVKFRAKTPLALFCFLNTLVFPAFQIPSCAHFLAFQSPFITADFNLCFRLVFRHGGGFAIFHSHHGEIA